MTQPNDMHFMGIALEEAQKGARAEEIPIGAVLVLGGKVMARNHNRCVTTGDPTAHAEIVVIREAAKRLRNYRLLGSVLYVTVEPCVMCVGAMIHARISRLREKTVQPELCLERSGDILQEADPLYLV